MSKTSKIYSHRKNASNNGGSRKSKYYDIIEQLVDLIQSETYAGPTFAEERKWLFVNLGKMPFRSNYTMQMNAGTNPKDPLAQGRDRIATYMKFGVGW